MDERCPICDSRGPFEPRGQFTADESVRIFAKGFSAPARAELTAAIRRLWQGDVGRIWQCSRCRHRYPRPYVGGDQDFYRLYLSTPHYPRHRWEFTLTEQLIRKIVLAEPGRSWKLLEIGGGDGGFLAPLMEDAAVRKSLDVWASEFSPPALDRLSERGVKCGPWTVEAMLAKPELAGSCDLLCAFNSVHFIAPADELFAGLFRLCAPGGHVFVSTANGEYLDLMDKLAGDSNVPPLIVGRYYRETFAAIAQRFGFELVETQISEGPTLPLAWRAAYEIAGAQSVQTGSLAGKISMVQYRPLRVALKAALTAIDLPRVLAHWSRLKGGSLWVHLRRPT